MKFIEYPDSEMMMIDLADALASELENALLTHDRVSFAVPGGTTPGPIFDNLNAVNLPWDRVSVMLTDERWVDETSERSNTRLLRQRLLIGQAQKADYVPLFNGARTPEDGLAALQGELQEHLPIDVMLLGMGTDMHTASIFPGADQLEHALHGDDLLVAMRAPGAPEPRITMSAKVLRGALNRHVVIIGNKKREALEAAQSLSVEQAPINAVLADTTVHWAES